MTGPRMPPPKASTATRLRWRVVVRTEGKLDPSRATRPLAWHMVTCVDPERADAHCAEGRQLIIDTQDPDGHCLLDGIGVCPRCDSRLEIVPG